MEVSQVQARGCGVGRNDLGFYPGARLYVVALGVLKDCLDRAARGLTVDKSPLRSMSENAVINNHVLHAMVGSYFG